MSLSVLTLELAEPFKIVVENRINSITPYILLEQETWFEPEVPFLQAFLQPGMKVIDVGTNCGFYTLLAAAKLGPQGHVWGFEPGTNPARMLAESLRINDFRNVTLYEAAVGPEPGTVWFEDRDLSELSGVVSADTPGTRAVRCESLDHLYDSGEIPSVDFIKIDAEGFEEEVMKGGAMFFQRTSPLVMLEVISDNNGVSMGAADVLIGWGYKAYRYYPGTNCLVPLVLNKIGDYVLNIFLCQPDREASLRARGLLCTDEDLTAYYSPASRALFAQYFKQLAVVQTCPELADLAEDNGEEAGYRTMCAEFLMSQDVSLSAGERTVRLFRAEDWIGRNFHGDMPPTQKLSFIRVWTAVGRRSLILGYIGAISDAWAKMGVTLSDPFLPAMARWETVPAEQGSIYPWLASMLIETQDKFGGFSSIYNKNATQLAYDLTRKYDYLTPELERRAALINLLSERDKFPAPLYLKDMPRNSAIWSEIAQKLAATESIVTKLDAGKELS